MEPVRAVSRQQLGGFIVIDIACVAEWLLATRSPADRHDSFDALIIRRCPERHLAVSGEADQGDLLPVDRVELIEIVNGPDRKSTRLNSSHVAISYAVFCLKKKK